MTASPNAGFRRHSRPGPRAHRRERGATLIEVLIAVIVLSFGLLSLGGMIAVAVQMPKLSGNRSTALSIGADLVERMRANTAGYLAGSYATNLTYDGSSMAAAPTLCTFPDCTPASLAAMDISTIQQTLRQLLPAGGLQITVDPDDSARGNLWVLWQEPASFVSFNTTDSDNCPAEAAGFTNPRPRCVYIPFKL